MSNRFNIYKDEFGQYHEVDEEIETPLDGFEDDDQEHFDDEEDNGDSHFDSFEDDDEDDEDKEYASERKTEYDSDED